MKTFLALCFLLFASTALAGPNDWGIVADPIWVDDPGVNVEYRLNVGIPGPTGAMTPTGALIGSVTTIDRSVPAARVSPNLVSAVAYQGKGQPVCITATAIRGTVRSLEVSECVSFRLAPVRSIVSPTQ